MGLPMLRFLRLVPADERPERPADGTSPAGGGPSEGIERRLEGLERRLDRLTEGVDALERQWSDLGQPLRRVERDLAAILRLLAIDSEELPYPERLTARRFGIFSDGEEDGLAVALFREIGAETRRFVEIGSGPNGGTTGFLAAELGWTGIMIDANEAYIAEIRRRFPVSRVAAVHTWVTREEIDALLSTHGFVGEVDLLSIDIDGNDYWVWEAISVVSPRVVCIEYNSSFGPERAVVVPYEAHFERRGVPGVKGRLYFGASLRAVTELGRRLGYRLVAVEPRGTSAYLLRDDVAPSIPTRDAREAYRPVVKHARLLPDGPDGFLEQLAELGLPLVDLDEQG